MSTPSFDDQKIIKALEKAVHEAFSEMLPGVAIEMSEKTDADRGMGDAAIVTLSGALCGSLAVQTMRDSTQELAKRIAGDLAIEDDGELADSGFLTQLEQDSLRELSNRVGCIFTGLLSYDENVMSPSFPIFVYGHDIDIRAECDFNVGLFLVIDGSMRAQARVFLAKPKPSADRAQQIRDIERLREELLAEEA